MYGHKIDHSIFLVILISFISVKIMLPFAVSLLLFICTFLSLICLATDLSICAVLESTVHFLTTSFFVWFFSL